MPTQTYTWRALDAGGALHAGELVCGSRAAVLDALSRQGLTALSVEQASGAGPARVDGRMPPWEILRDAYRLRTRVSPRELVRLTESLAALSKAGLTIDKALQISATLAPTTQSRALTRELLQAVRSGKTFSGALATSGQSLPTYFTSMVEAGEAGGSLPETLARLAQVMARQLEVRERIRSALIYPSMLAGVVLFTLVTLLVFVLPRFESLFAESEAPLPWSTRAVLGGGRFVADYWWCLLLALGAAIGSFALWRRSHRGRHAFDGWLLRTRITLGLPAAVDTARFLRTVSALSRNGLPLASTLRVARGTVVNRCLLDALESVTRDVQAGETFSTALGRAGHFPAVAVQLCRVGEETGHLEELLGSAADVLEDESQRTLERLLSLVVPVLTITMGLIVAGLISSVLIGLLSINELAF
jgi:general secretion pathway protein F